MRILCCVSLVVCLLVALAGPAPAEQPAEARAIIDKAIAAVGGKDKLARAKHMTWNEKGTYYGMGDGLPYTGHYAMQWPNQFRMEIEGVFTMVVNGDQGWLKSDKGTIEMPKEMLASQKEDLYGGWVASLLPLENKAFTLAALPETKIADHAAVGVKVSHKDRSDVELYFDKEKGLLVKSTFTTHDPEKKNKEVKQEVLFSEYKEFDGIKLPTKLVIKRDGKLFVEAASSDFKMPEKVDEKLFAKP
jgi:hypothetical protein